MPYVDGFVVAVPKKNLKAYAQLSKKAGKVWRAHGALDYREWVADDVKPGKLTSFPQSVKLKPSCLPGSPTSHAPSATGSTPR
ncbi:uncharacterized protein YbaA (DUF1428 family) [Bradyrhizobium sp. JR3.5]